MTHPTQDTPKPINEMENGQEGGTIPSRTKVQNSTVVGEGPGAGAVPAVAKPKGDLERRWRRKNDITTSHGLAREHARLIAAMHNGRVGLAAGDILSRAYGRQRELVAANETTASIADLAQQIADLRRERSVVSDVWNAPRGKPGGEVSE